MFTTKSFTLCLVILAISSSVANSRFATRSKRAISWAAAAPVTTAAPAGYVNPAMMKMMMQIMSYMMAPPTTSAPAPASAGYGYQPAAPAPAPTSYGYQPAAPVTTAAPAPPASYYQTAAPVTAAPCATSAPATTASSAYAMMKAMMMSGYGK